MRSVGPCARQHAHKGLGYRCFFHHTGAYGQGVIYLSTVTGITAQFTELSQRLLPPETEVWHIVDEMLAAGRQPGATLALLLPPRAEHAVAAEAAGADALQVTCSSLAVRARGSAQVGIPVLAVDEAMVDEALRQGRASGSRQPRAPRLNRWPRRCAAGRAAWASRWMCRQSWQRKPMQGWCPATWRCTTGRDRRAGGPAPQHRCRAAGAGVDGPPPDALPPLPGAAPILASPPFALAAQARAGGRLKLYSSC